jgi:hypothetical protein
MTAICFRAMLCPVLITAALGAETLTSGDAYIRFDTAGTAWDCGTGLIEQRLELSNGRFRLAALRNRLTGTEYVAGAASDEFRFLLGGLEYTGDTGGYTLKDYQIRLHAQVHAGAGKALRRVLLPARRLGAGAVPRHQPRPPSGAAACPAVSPVFPKALVADTRYVVTFRFNKGAKTATGAELMKQGIRFASSEKQEMILLNLDRAPGRHTDHTPPTTPAKAEKRIETYGGRAGVALRWSPSQDDGLIAEYRVLRDGQPLDRVGIGTFYFDAGAGLDHRYEIMAVDGDGNRSGLVAATE